MISPFPKSSSAPGEGHIVTQLLPHGITGLSTITYQYPLKLISPSPSASQKSVLAFLLTYGGGLVGGDQVNLQITVRPKSKLSIVTQGHTKIFKSPTRDVITRQNLRVRIEAGAALCLLPDPVQPFGESAYEQSQIFELHDGASVCLLDWVTSGRTARGEEWDFFSWKGRNEVWSLPSPRSKGRLLLRDNVMLDSNASDDQEMSLRKRMHDLRLFGTMVLRGPQVESLAAFFADEFAALPRIGERDFRSREAITRDSGKVKSSRESWRARRLALEREEKVLWSAAKVRGCTVVKFGAPTVESGRTWISDMIKEEGSILECFGEDSLMCIR